MSESETPQDAPNLPPLYSEIIPINESMHGGYSLRSRRSYRYAATQVSLPLNLAEFSRAAISYPIAFAATEPSFPIAILGVTDGVNLFVNAEGEWERGHYVPAYARRYPFFLAKDRNSEKLAFCVDRSEDVLEQSDREPLLSEGKPTEALNNALEFCRNYERAQTQTRQIVETFENLGLLIERQVTIDTASGEKMRIGGFKMIDEEKFKDLPPELLTDWRDREILTGIYAQKISQENWSRLVQRHSLSAAAA